MLTIAKEACPRCGCLAYERDEERGLVCLLCARPLNPAVNTTRYTGNNEDKLRSVAANGRVRR